VRQLEGGEREREREREMSRVLTQAALVGGELSHSCFYNNVRDARER